MRILVLGGGLAGLAAAALLSGERHAVTLVEARPRLGGGAYAVLDDASGDLLPTGRHLFVGRYGPVRAFFDRIGAGRDLTLLPLRALNAPGGASPPPPLGILAAIAGGEGVSFTERLLLLRVAAAIHAPSRIAPAPEERESADAWLARLSQSPSVRRAFWTPIGRALVGDELDRTSARTFGLALRDALLSDTGRAALTLPQPSDPARYGDAAGRYLAGRGVVLRLGTKVNEILVRGAPPQATAFGAVLEGGERIEADAVIAALPPRAVLDLVPPDARRDDPYFGRFAELAPAPAVSVHLWLDRPLPASTAAARGDGPFAWTILAASGSGARASMLALGARSLAFRSPDQLTALATAELHRASPAAARAWVLRSRVIVEPEASFAHGVGVERPRTVSSLAGLYVAGDYARAMVVAGLDSAIFAGENAARAALDFEPPPGPEPKALVPVESLVRRAREAKAAKAASEPSPETATET